MTVTSPRRGVFADLFCGGGGLSYGAEQGGFDCALAADIEPQHVGVHHYNMPYGAGVVTDLGQATGDDLRRGALRATDIDLIGLGRNPEMLTKLTAVFGGPPCQGLSNMGRKDPSDIRNDLVDHFLRLVGELQPRYAVMENVPGLLEARNRPVLDGLLERAHQIGFNVVTPIRTLRAIDFGVPQTRERIIIMLYRRGENAPAYPEPTHAVDPNGSDLFLRRTPTVAEALDDLPDADLFEALLTSDEVRLDGFDPGYISSYALGLKGLANDVDDLSYPRLWDPQLLTCSMRTRHSDKTRGIYERTPPGKSAGEGHNLPRLHPDRYSPTLRAGSVGGTYDGRRVSGHTAPRPIHHRLPRVITVREGMRLHSYPDHVRLHATKFQGFRELGNSVPPLLARAIAHQIRIAAGLAPEKPTDALAPGNPELLLAEPRAAHALLAA
ncbi:hypothetical protein CKO28_04900 [Rhodovibrio sodomensis]|uniref:DNA (cytosine-5-)-methyltransferase n=1 Tax=Rhodovibrio sodomensis TaxID=1088 RepID=A0ABS1DB71_9PROT|nr:DNA cytosine methyltransferase [Rhodovibrio sodomensis]MBK1667367.1 hypothetical protein [Rhodovibrio sodomensis]